uniref:PsbP C-terminal domain-containing protein n=1 Tax=Chaetoceros debilis TaxID=122233 RepID=A0A7S3QGE7_9STRA
MLVKTHLLLFAQLVQLSYSFQSSPCHLNNLSRSSSSRCANSELRMGMGLPLEDDDDDDDDDVSSDRRSFLQKASTGSAATIMSAAVFLNNPYLASASASAVGEDNAPIILATFARRRVGALPASLTSLPPNKLGIFQRLGEAFLYSNDATRTAGKDIFASFDFPADWLQLDRFLGGIQYVDQRNGDKLYVLKVPLPSGIETLKEVPKAYFGDTIFNPNGELVKNGNDIEEYKVLSSSMLETAEDSPPRRRLKVRYTTITGNNFSVERKGLVDIYEVGGMCYMLMTGSNAVRFDKKGVERDVVEYIADSFRVTKLPSVV